MDGDGRLYKGGGERGVSDPEGLLWRAPQKLVVE